jgi:hypothetical protein
MRDDDGPPRPQQSSYVRLVTERMPHTRAVVLQLVAHDEAFRDLCMEYAACHEAAERSQLPEYGGVLQEAFRAEFGALRLRLEGELLRYMSQHGSGDRPR